MLSTHDKILLAFDGKRVVSGAWLAGRLGLTRASVWKHIKSLRKEGFPIQTRKGSGYELTRPFDFSLLRGDAMRGAAFWKLHYQLCTSSTQTLAKQAADHGSPEGHLWIAERQTAGRGRLERQWESRLGGLWMSLLLKPAIAPSEIPALTLVASLALAQTIRSGLGLEARLKWPNDVVVETSKGWRKVAGILTEMSAEVDRIRWVVIGIGVNANNPLSNSLSDRATTLGNLNGQLLSRARLLKTFLDSFGKLYRRFEKGGFEPFRAAYWDAYSRPNQSVHLKTAHGPIKGVARGIDARGALLVESLNQIQPVWEGEIVL